MTTRAEVLFAGAPRSLSSALLDSEARTLGAEARRFVVGAALAAAYGAALGAPLGIVGMASHAAGVPLVFFVVALLGTPALYVGSAHLGVEIDPRALAAAIARGSACGGLALAGLAPPMLLMSVTCESPTSVRLLGAAGLV